ncbi:NADP-dependent oxidoreductase [Bosea psychrotolerans]|uniref:NADPH:quinone reductase-like Zn-dependent oxidoreductase n=1 Tax=Bosea psychrotolerans TaxID=1871628 RepID=A0A2S4MD43_9HYPH|nr:NADP-dependent oxidoreductase [Bosea psychrotolerans]POR52634.1 NADPH:quinone reductase-like Zn-dependent oxidoreductase [Bosea psychrotolerans]
MSDVMKAVRLHKFGGPDVLVYEDAPKPQAKAGEVLVRVHAIGVNPPDWYLREGYRMLPPAWQPAMTLPIIPGTDISGVVEAVGDGVTSFSAGDEVYAMVRFPSGLAGGSQAYAQYVTVPVGELALKPAGIDHVQAAAAPMSLLTAWQFLIAQGHDVPNPLQARQHLPVPLNGKRVLVNGAGGGVGHLLVQLAKWQGAHVTAVSSGKHEAMLRDFGVDLFLDYKAVDVETAVTGLDLVVDAVGGAKSARFLKTLKRGGALFPIFGLGFDGHDEAAQLGVTVSTTQVNSHGGQLAEIAPLLSDGTIRVAIDSIFTLAQARKAHERAAAGHLQGKIVLTVADGAAA